MGARPIVAVAVLASLLLAPAPPPADAQTGPAGRLRSYVAYDWPVPGAVVRAFDTATGPYGAGHRGVDLRAAPGQLVRPMGPGVVTWSGVVAGDRWVSVTHRDGVVTSYGPLQSGAVVTGDVVTATDVVGRAEGAAHGTVDRLHVGARRDGRYVDPAGLVAAARRMVATLVGPGTAAVADVATPTGRLVLVPGTPPSPNHLVVLPGLTSATGGQPFRLDRLGYTETTWQQFSYLGVDAQGRPRPYDHEATWGRVHEMGLALRDQLRAHAAANPAQAVDLLGHSLGGLVAVYYLLVLHDPTDPTLPAIGSIATVASPLAGTDSADAVTHARSTSVGRALLDLVESRFATPTGGEGPVMHRQMPVLDDLRTDSAVVQAIAAAWRRHRADPWSSPLATGTDVLTVGTTLDIVVNEHRASLPGAPHETVLEWSTHAHSLVTHDARTEELLSAHLAGEPLPGGGLAGMAVDVTAPLGSHAIAEVEQAIAEVVGLVSALVG